jgi:hypothetical protein
MSEFGFKEINSENWLKPDEVIQHFPSMRCMEDYVEVVLAPKLSEKVPQDIRALFEVTRGALLYGYLFYPLYDLAVGQLFRVGEAALIHKCTQLGAPKVKKKKNKERKMTFSDYIDWLAEKGVFSHDEADHWHTLRTLRNSASHATRQSIRPPGMAVGILDHVTRDINALFDK